MSDNKQTWADGWHKFYGVFVYTEGNRILRGVKDGTKTVYPYIERNGALHNVSGKISRDYAYTAHQRGKLSFQ